MNEEWYESFPDSFTAVLEPDISDHSPLICLKFPPQIRGPAPFRYLTTWANHEDFMKVVEEAVHATLYLKQT